MTFYSQNDPRWKYDRIGSSNVTVGRYGCTLTSVGTLGTYFGENRNPGELAKSLSFTSDGRILWKSIDEVYDTMKFEWRFYGFQKDLIEKALRDPDKVVLLQVDRGYHWVALLGKVLTYYRCSDPWPFPAVKRLYKSSEITGGAILSRK